MWWDHDVGWAGSLMMSFGMLGVWAVVALLVVIGVRASRRSDAERSPETQATPRQILERRLAQGEIGVEEFHERLAALESPTEKDTATPAAPRDGRTEPPR